MATNEPIMASVAGRYASALFDLASEGGQVAQVEKDLDTFQKIYDESEDLRRLVRSPVIPSEDQGKAIAAVLEKSRVGATTLNFFKVIARNRRLFSAPDMVRAYRSLAAKARGEVTAEVISAVALSDAHVVQLKDTLKACVGKDVSLATRVDPSILGGLVVKIGSRMVDNSLKTKLTNLKVTLRGTS